MPPFLALGFPPGKESPDTKTSFITLQLFPEEPTLFPLFSILHPQFAS